MCFAGPSIPAAPAAPPPMPKESDPSVKAAVDAEEARRRAMQGRKSTILTGPAGLNTPAPTMPKTILGA